MNRKTDHISYVFKQEGAIVYSLGFTHNKNDISLKNLLNYNINPNDNRDCYVKLCVEKQKYNDYRLKKRLFKLSHT